MITLSQRLCLSSSLKLKISSRIKRYATMTPVPVAEIGEELTRKYRPYLLPNEEGEKDWISEQELDTVERISKENLQRGEGPLKILVLYGWLRERFVCSPLYM